MAAPKSVLKWHLARCPLCPDDNNLHKIRMHWTGTGRPIKFCSAHQKKAGITQRIRRTSARQPKSAVSS